MINLRCFNFVFNEKLKILSFLSFLPILYTDFASKKRRDTLPTQRALAKPLTCEVYSNTGKAVRDSMENT